MKKIVLGECKKAKALCTASNKTLRLLEEHKVLSGYRLYLSIDLLLKRQSLFSTFFEKDTENGRDVKVTIVEIVGEDTELIGRCIKEMMGEGITTMPTDAGIIFTRNGRLRDSLDIEVDNYDEIVEMIYSNYTLYCLGIYQLRSLTQPPSDTVFQKFLYTCKINSVKNVTSNDVLRPFATTIQGIISIFGFLDYRLVDGLLCPVTLSAINAFGAKFDSAKSGAGVVVGESSNLLEKVSPLVKEFRKTMDKLRLIKWKTSGNLYIAFPLTFRRTFFKIQKMCGIERSGILDSRTLAEVDRTYDLLSKSRKALSEDLTLEVGEQIIKCASEYAPVHNNKSIDTRCEAYVSYWKSLVNSDRTEINLKGAINSVYNGNGFVKQNSTMKPMSRLVERLRPDCKTYQRKGRTSRNSKPLASSTATVLLDDANSASSLTFDTLTQSKHHRTQRLSSQMSPQLIHNSHKQRTESLLSSNLTVKSSLSLKSLDKSHDTFHQFPLFPQKNNFSPLRKLNTSHKTSSLLEPFTSSLQQYGYPPWVTLPRVNCTSRIFPIITTIDIDLNVSNSDSSSSITPQSRTASESNICFSQPSSSLSNQYVNTVEVLQKLELLKTHSDILTNLFNATKSESNLDFQKIVDVSTHQDILISLTKKVNDLSNKVIDLESDIQRSKFVFSMCREGLSELKTQLDTFESNTSKALSKISK